MKKAVPLRVWRWNGQAIVPLRSGLPLSDRGFRYGWHLFETLAFHGGRILLLKEHMDLLDASASRNGFPFPASVRKAIGNFVRGLSLPDGVLRIYLTAGPGAPCSPVTDPGCYLAWERAEFPCADELERGYRLVTLRRRGDLSGWGEKSGNYLDHCKALGEARSRGADEALLLDARGRAVSCAMGNILLWMNGEDRPVTPARESGARAGSLLGWVRGKMEIGEAVLRIGDFRRARAMAVTNSRIGVMPVSRLDGKDLCDQSHARLLALSYLQDRELSRLP